MKKLVNLNIPRVLRLLFVLLVVLFLLNHSVAQIADASESIQLDTRDEMFGFGHWTVSSLLGKAVNASLKADKFLDRDAQVSSVKSWLDSVRKVSQLDRELDQALANPETAAQSEKLVQMQAELRDARRERDLRAELAESVLQSQTEGLLAEVGFGLGGQVFPPLLFHVSDLPLNLIVSPRTEIRTLISINLRPGLDAMQKEAIETHILEEYSLSALVEPVGGLGVYPTMVMETDNLYWLADTIAHEWLHNYLAFTPLGFGYGENSTMQTMNETTASIFGGEVGRELIRRYYPAWNPWPRVTMPRMVTVLRADEQTEQPFDFRGEMRITRLGTDTFLAQGRVADAESWMEQRRLFLREHGYAIRKLNQAYFAFYGSYNDSPGGGASGLDPVGPAVQLARKESEDLYDFIRRMRGLRSYEALLELTGATPLE